MHFTSNPSNFTDVLYLAFTVLSSSLSLCGAIGYGNFQSAPFRLDSQSSKFERLLTVAKRPKAIKKTHRVY